MLDFECWLMGLKLEDTDATNHVTITITLTSVSALCLSIFYRGIVCSLHYGLLMFDCCSTACTTMVGNNSLDYPLLVANDTYIFTAGNCVMCSCNAASNWT